MPPKMAPPKRRRNQRKDSGAPRQPTAIVVHCPHNLPRYEVVIDIESKECPCCGAALHVIGDDRTEMLDLVPAQLRVKVVCRPRYGCRTCEGAVVQAPAPERPIDGGMATEALVAHVVVSKFCVCRSTARHRCSSGRHHAGSFDAERLDGNAHAGG